MENTAKSKVSTWEFRPAVPLRRYLPVLVGTLVLVGAYLIRLQSYLLFHSLAEVFSIAVCFGVFMLAWNSRRLVQNYYLLWVGVGYFFTGVLLTFHMLSYEGMGVIVSRHANMPTQLWISTRYLEAFVFMTAPLFVKRKPNLDLTFGGFGLATALILLSILHWRNFPTCFSPGLGGLTTFKIVSEFVIASMLAASIVFLLRKRAFSSNVVRLLVASMALSIAAEMLFTLYSDVYGITNLLGHYLKGMSVYLVYKALIETGLAKPYAVLLHDLKEHERALEAFNENLEQRVAERTAVADQRLEQLRALTLELSQAEQRERRHLSQVLHDHLQQLLVAAKLRVGLARSRVADSPVRKDLEEVDDLLAQSIQSSRSLTVELSPPVLYESGLPAALEWLGDWMRDKHGIEVTVDLVSQIQPRREEVTVFLFNAVREMLFNVVKHANAGSARVFMGQPDASTLAITVEDSGKGFDPSLLSDTSRAGFGLFSIRERAELLGGELLVQSSPGEGTRLTLLFPSSE